MKLCNFNFFTIIFNKEFLYFLNCLNLISLKFRGLVYLNLNIFDIVLKNKNDNVRYGRELKRKINKYLF